MTLTDTGPLVALVNRNDPNHAACVTATRRLPSGPLITTWPCFTEAMYLVPRIWTEDNWEHKGQFIDLAPRPVHPKPLQDPHPPLYMACTHNETLNDAGARGIGALVLGFGSADESVV